MKRSLLALTLFIIFFLCACSNGTKLENKQLKDKIVHLEKELDDRNNELDELKNGKNETITINYIENTYNKRFVEKQCSMLALPVDGSALMRTIPENTVVSVIDTAEVNASIWLNISVPVYDSPSNYKGWIKESDSIPYTEETKDKVQGEITVKKGECAYETVDFEDIEATSPYVIETEERGRIIEKRDGYLQLNCPGGRIIWIKESSATYPSVE